MTSSPEAANLFLRAVVCILIGIFLFGGYQVIRTEMRASEGPLPLFYRSYLNDAEGRSSEDRIRGGTELLSPLPAFQTKLAPLKSPRRVREDRGRASDEDGTLRPKRRDTRRQWYKFRQRRWVTPPPAQQDRGVPKEPKFKMAVTEGCEPATIQGVVWSDENSNGIRDPVEPLVEGISVKLLVDTDGDANIDNLVTSMFTDAQGGYVFTEVDPCQPNYTIQFVPGPFSTWTVHDAGDDDTIDSDPLPTQFGLTPFFQIAADTSVTGIDAGLVPRKLDYDTWQANVPGAGDDPFSNNDQDLYVDLIEYALCLDPNSGTPDIVGVSSDRAGFTVTKDPSGSLQAHYTRPVGGADGVTYELQHSHDRVAWTAVPEITTIRVELGPAVERVTYLDLEEDEAVTRNGGFLRLAITLTATGETAFTPEYGWQAMAITPGFQTFSPSFFEPEVYAGGFAALGSDSLLLLGETPFDSSTLDPDLPYFAEIVSGSGNGRRYVIDRAASSADTLVIDLAAPPNTHGQLTGLSDGRLVIRPASTLRGIFDTETFHGSLSPGMADQLSFFESDRFTSYFLLDNGAIKQWTGVADTSLADAGNRAILPGDGVFVRREGATVELLTIGMVRQANLALRLDGEFNLVGFAWSLAASPQALGLLEAAFQGDTNPAIADQIQRWEGDGSVGALGYASAFLLDDGSSQRFWTDVDDLTLADLNQRSFLAPSRACFIRRMGAPVVATIRLP